MEKIFVYVVVIYIVIAYLITAIKWFYIMRDFNINMKQSFPALLYSIFWLIPILNLFTTWNVFKDLKESSVSKEISAKQWLKLMASHYLIGAAFSLMIFIMLIAIVLMAFTGFGEFLITISPFISLAVSVISFFWVLNQLKNLSKTIRGLR